MHILIVSAFTTNLVQFSDLFFFSGAMIPYQSLKVVLKYPIYHNMYLFYRPRDHDI